MDRFISSKSRLSKLDLLSSSACTFQDESLLCSCIHSTKKHSHDGNQYLSCLASPKSAYKHAIARTLHASQSSTRMTDPLLRNLYACLPISTAQQYDPKAQVSVMEAFRRSQIDIHQYHRSVASAPERVLDAPGLLDDFYLHLLDWGPSNCLAVALGPSVYLWNASSGSVSELTSVNEPSLALDAYVSSLKWVQSENDPPILAVGTSEGTVQLWNVAAERKLRDMQYTSCRQASAPLRDQLAPHRVSALAWNSSILSSGHRAGHIFHSDVRVARHQVSSMLKAHVHDVCGLAWSTDGTQLASGGNDNILNIWEGFGSSTPRHCLTQHTAAVKALAWCPWRSRLLASGGGSADQTIRTWNSTTGACLSTTHTGSQVTSLLWSPDTHRELISSHGFSENQIVVWRYPSMTKLTELKCHTGRIVSLTMSPNGRTVVSAGADENLNFWSLYPDGPSSCAKNPSLSAVCHNTTTPTTAAARKTFDLLLPSPPTQAPSSGPSYRSVQTLSPSRPIASPLLKSHHVMQQRSRPTLPTRSS